MAQTSGPGLRCGGDALEQIQPDADLIARDQGGENGNEPLLQGLQPSLGDCEQGRLLALGLKDRRGILLPGQLAHVQLFLLGETALMELRGENQPDQGCRQNLPRHRRDG
jgi:hypothetical protein